MKTNLFAFSNVSFLFELKVSDLLVALTSFSAQVMQSNILCCSAYFDVCVCVCEGGGGFGGRKIFYYFAELTTSFSPDKRVCG